MEFHRVVNYERVFEPGENVPGHVAKTRGGESMLMRKIFGGEWGSYGVDDNSIMMLYGQIDFIFA